MLPAIDALNRQLCSKNLTGEPYENINADNLFNFGVGVYSSFTIPNSFLVDSHIEIQ